jgi:FlaA1/EpsC-like NDP-sugar epimerase
MITSPSTSLESLESHGVLRVARCSIEVVVLGGSFLAAFAYRFELPLPSVWSTTVWQLLLPVVLLQILLLRLLGCSRHTWRYVSIRDIEDVATATTVGAAVLLTFRLAPWTPEPLLIPIGVILANWVLTTVGLSGARVLRRIQTEHRESRTVVVGPNGRSRVLLIGAGRAGVMVATELDRRPELGMVAVGFVDDDPAKIGRRIGGLDVIGSMADVADIARVHDVGQVIISMAAVSRADMVRIIAQCRDAGLDPKIIPGLFEIVGGMVDLARIRPVAVEDLLGRDPVALDDASVRGLVGGRTVLITGAGGSIGSELARQAARFGPAAVVLMERSEPALWAIDRELRQAYPELVIVAAIGDVTDRARVERIFTEHDPQVVVHAAAHKHVPMMEEHPGEAVKNNVGGTKIVADVAAAHRVERFVLVSTDKAVNPTSVMGATKRIAERYVQHVAARTGLNFVAVRFGNVLGSAGSVVPIFHQQVKAGGPVMVTHPEMVRYFMTIPEASGLVLQAAALGKSGEILVLDMGDPVKIVDLAKNVIRLSGFEPDVDIQIEFSGLRPGEKMFEELNFDNENAARTRHPKVWIGRSANPTWDDAKADVARLLAVADTDNPAGVRQLIGAVVPEFTGARIWSPGATVIGGLGYPPRHDSISVTAASGVRSGPSV